MPVTRWNAVVELFWAEKPQASALPSINAAAAPGALRSTSGNCACFRTRNKELLRKRVLPISATAYGPRTRGPGSQESRAIHCRTHLMKIFHVDSSPKVERSSSRMLAQHFLGSLRQRGTAIEVDYLDVSRHTPPHPTELYASAIYSAPEARTDQMIASLETSDALCRRLLDSDALLFAMPMHNFTVPSSFKTFIDSIVRAGVTYRVTSDGRYVGQLGEKQVLFITTRGSDFRPGTGYESYDALTPALRAAFGFIGVSSPSFVDAQPLQFADQTAREAALARARSELDQVAQEWAAASGTSTQATAVLG